MKSIMCIIFTILFIQTLSGQDGNKSNFAVLNLTESFSRQQEVPLSRFVEKIAFIPLETNPQAMSGILVDYEVTNEYIIVRQTTHGIGQILLFNRNTGKFIREIGKQGRGPGEYNSIQYIPFDPVRKELYAKIASGELLVYDTLGRNIDIIKEPKINDKYGVNKPLSTRQINFENMLNDHIFVGTFNNGFGDEKNRMVLFTKEGDP